MEVVALNVRITEADLLALAERIDREVEHSLEDVRIELTAAGIKISGAYPLFIRVKFESLWTTAVRDGKLHVRLADLKAMGVPAAILRSAVVKLLEDAIKGRPGIWRDEDAIVLDLDRALSERLFPVSVNLQDVRIAPGVLILVAGQTKMEA